jgi:hypothetical protein
MKRVHLLVVAETMALGSLSCAQSGHWKLELSPPASAAATDSSEIEIQAGETTIVELVVVGAASGSFAFGASNLPPFATMNGPALKLSPTRQDAGGYAVTLTASDGAETQSVTLDLVVQRSEAPPRWSGGYMFGDGTGFRRDCLSPSTCTALGTPKLYMTVCDADDDRIIVDVEVVRRGEPFVKVPTHSVSVASGYSEGLSRDCASRSVSLTGLPPEESYDFAIRVSDEFGAVANVPLASSDGWLRRDFFGFDQGPCTTRQCACVAAGGFGCIGDPYKCCSGICDTTAAAGGACR